MLTRGKSRLGLEAKDTIPAPTSAPRRLRLLHYPTKWRFVVSEAGQLLQRRLAENTAAVSQRKLLQHDLNRTLQQQAQRQRRDLLIDDREEDYVRLLGNSRDPRDRQLVELVRKVDETFLLLSSHTSQCAKKRRCAGPEQPADSSSVRVYEHYNIGHPLMPYQQEGVRWLLDAILVRGHNVILADDMGLGKTIQTISVLLAMHHQSPSKLISLVVAPLTAVRQWEAEVQRIQANEYLAVYCIIGSRDERSTAASAALLEMKSKRTAPNTTKGRSVVVLCSYDGIIRRGIGANELALLHSSFDGIVVDEAQRIKNDSSILFQRLLRVQTRWKLLLSGTPLQNDLGELFNFLAFLFPAASKSSRDHAKELVVSVDALLKASSRRNDQRHDDEFHLIMCRRIHRLLAPFVLRREKKDVLSQLPEKSEHILVCPTMPQQLRKLEQLRKDKESGILRKPFTIEARKVLLHPYATEHSFYIDEDVVRSSGKFVMLDFILTFLMETRHKCLIFSAWTTVIDILETMLRWRGIAYAKLTGKTPLADRQDILKAFNGDPHFSIPCFLLSKGAGGVALNLQAADTVVLFDVDYNPQKDHQALSRAYRVGQTKDVKILRLVSSDTVETRMCAIAKRKERLDRKIVHAGMYDVHATAAERETKLREVLRRDAAAASDGDEGGEKDDARSAPSEDVTPANGNVGEDEEPVGDETEYMFIVRSIVDSGVLSCLPRASGEAELLPTVLQRFLKRGRDGPTVEQNSSLRVRATATIVDAEEDVTLDLADG